MSLDKSLYCEFSSVNEAEMWGNKHYGNWAEGYQKNMRTLNKIFKITASDVLERYCGYDYQHINAVLRNPECYYECKNLYVTMSEVLAVTIISAPKVPANIVVYRGVPSLFVDKLYREYSHGWVQEKGFLSTSLLRTIDMDHNFDALLRIYLPKGVSGAYVPCVAGRSEQEMLMLPNSFIKLTGKKILTSPKRSWETINDRPVFDCELTYMV